MRRGILVADEGGNIAAGDIRYRSDRDHLQVDLTRNPKHMDTLTMRGGSAFSDYGFGVQREVLFEIEHGYDRAPYALAYFYVQKVDFIETGDYLEQGGYGNDFYVMSGSGGAADDLIFAEVDEKYFRIVHELRSYGFDTGATSKGPEYTFRIKYYISSLALGK